MKFNSNDPARTNWRPGDDLEVPGVGYVKLGHDQNSLTVGRQLIATPFANPGDALIVPMAFEGYSFGDAYRYAMSLKEFKDRPSEEFVDVRDWAAGRDVAQPATGAASVLPGPTWPALKPIPSSATASLFPTGSEPI